jgi:hypothetical protein
MEGTEQEKKGDKERELQEVTFLTTHIPFLYTFRTELHYFGRKLYRNNFEVMSDVDDKAEKIAKYLDLGVLERTRPGKNYYKLSDKWFNPIHKKFLEQIRKYY